MSVADRTSAAFNRRQRCNEEVMRELKDTETKRSASAQLAKITCPCGLPRGKNHPICFGCWKALPEHIKNGLQAQTHEAKRVATELAITFAAGRRKPSVVAAPRQSAVPTSPTNQPQSTAALFRDAATETHRHD